MNEKHEESVWEAGWHDHQLRQLERMARLPFAAKLRWLEQAHRLVRQLSNAQTPENVAGAPSTRTAE